MRIFGVKVRCVTTGVVYDSATKAAEMNGLHATTIIACCVGRRKKCGGMEWQYEDPSHILQLHATKKTEKIVEDAVVEMYVQKYPIKMIMEICHISKRTLYRILKQRGIRRNRYMRAV